MAADVALEGPVEAVTAHVDGEHDVVQEEDVTVEAAEGAHRLSVPVQHLHALRGGGEGAGTLFEQGGGRGGSSLPPRLLGLPGAGCGTAVVRAGGWVVELSDLGRSPAALLLCCALRVRGVGAAVGRSGAVVLVASQPSAPGPGALSGGRVAAAAAAQNRGGMRRRRLVVLLFTPVHTERRGSGPTAR